MMTMTPDTSMTTQPVLFLSFYFNIFDTILSPRYEVFVSKINQFPQYPDSAHALFVRATYLVCHRLISSWKVNIIFVNCDNG